jgi:hypothetical protein
VLAPFLLDILFRWYQCTVKDCRQGRDAHAIHPAYDDHENLYSQFSIVSILSTMLYTYILADYDTSFFPRFAGKAPSQTVLIKLE